MGKTMFLISRGLEKAGGATRAMQFAAIAAEQGNEVVVTLIDDAVHWAQIGMAEGIRSTTGEQMADMLQKLHAAGGIIHVCKACADKRQLDPEDFIDGASIAAGPDAVRMMTDPAVKVITF